MAQIKSLVDNSVSISPNSSNVNVYSTGDTPMQVLLDAGEQVTLAGINGGNPITTSPFPFTYNASTFPSGINPVVVPIETGTFEVEVKINGLPDEYGVYVKLDDESDFTLWIDNKRQIEAGKTITINSQGLAGYNISPSTITVLVDQDRVVTFTATAISEWIPVDGTQPPNWVETSGTIVVSGNTLTNTTSTTSYARTILNLPNGALGKIRVSNLMGALIGVSFNQTDLSNNNGFAYYAEHNAGNGKTQCRDVVGGTFDSEYFGSNTGASLIMDFTTTQVIFTIDGVEFGRATRAAGISTIKAIIATNNGTAQAIEQQGFTA